MNIIDPTFPHFFWSDDISNFIDRIFQIASIEVQNSLIRFVKSDEKILLSVLTEKPDFVMKIDLDQAGIRNFWKTKLQKCGGSILDIYSIMLRNGMIPKSEIDEANIYLVDKVKTYCSKIEDHFVLERFGFPNKLREFIFSQKNPDNFEWFNKHAYTIRGFLEFNALDVELLECFNKIFGGTYYPFKLYNQIKVLMEEKPTFKEDWERISRSNDLEIPDPIYELLME